MKNTICVLGLAGFVFFINSCAPPQYKIAYNVGLDLENDNGEYDIYTIRTDGSGLTKITESGFNKLYHVGSPDGKMLMYDGFDLKQEKFSIFIMNADGSEKRQLTNDYQFEQAPILVNAP